MNKPRVVLRLLTFGSALGAVACASDEEGPTGSVGGAEESGQGASETRGSSEGSGADPTGEAGTTTGSDDPATGPTTASTAGQSSTSGGEAATTDASSDAAGTAGETTGSDTSSETGEGSPGCGSMTSRPDPRDQQTIQVGDLQRYYLMYVPEDRDPEQPLALVFGIHGLDMNNVWAAHDESGFQLIEATDDQAILIYPQGIRADGQSVEPSAESQWGTADSNWGGPPPAADATRMAADLAYFDALIEYATENYCIDLDRVYAVGFSQGGFMTNTLGCERAEVFRGLAPVAGWGPLGPAPSCSDATASHAVLQVQGQTDGTVTPQLGEATRDFWRMRAGCSDATMPSSWGEGCVEYQDCAAETPVVYCTHDGGHFVPGGSGQRAWDFFQSLE